MNGTPRAYQVKGHADIWTAWREGIQNILYTLSTGGGKTFLFCMVLLDILHVPTCVIAHRKEILGQISLTLAKQGIYHRIIGPESLVRMVVRIHQEALGKVYYNSDAPVAVASALTLISWAKLGRIDAWCRSVRYWVLDEAHHCQQDNTWGRAVELFPYAKGLGVTATPERTDGQGLGRIANGVFDKLIEGPSAASLMSDGYLCRYRIICPPTTGLDLSEVRIGKDGDHVRKGLGLATRKSSIMGDVAAYYKLHAWGKLGITFAPDIETAKALTESYLALNVPAKLVTGETPEPERLQVMRDFKAHNVWQLVNVDLFDEGVDVPGVEVVSMARHSLSIIKVRQQFGRMMRPAPGKDKALCIDHVGNMLNPGWVPDADREWSLASRDKKRAKSDAQPLRACVKCLGPFSRWLSKCPYCGAAVAASSNRSAPEFVEGDLFELDEVALEQLRAGVARVDKPAHEVLANMQRAGHPYPVAKGAANQHAARSEAQEKLREIIAVWAGHRRASGHPDSDSYRKFYHENGVDVLTAQTLGRPQAEELKLKIEEQISKWLI